jgi:hypothetical protein
MLVPRLGLLALIVAVGCTKPYKRSAPAVVTTPPEPVAQLPVPTPPSPPPLVPPPPPLPAVADTRGVPDPVVVPAGGVEPRRSPEPPIATPAPPPNDREAVGKVVAAAAERWATVPDFEARFVKREVAHGKQIPPCEMVYRFRQQPHSVYLKVVAGAGEGREVLYVRGKFADRMHVLTGKGDNALVGVGFKTDMDPHDKQVTAKSRYNLTEAGFGRVIGGLQKQLALADSKVTLKPLGAVHRAEYPYPLDGVEAIIPPGVDPTLPKGGTRQIFFDPKPESPGHRLPVLVTCREPDGREVEYYCFDKLKVPSGWQDGDWNPARLRK